MRSRSFKSKLACAMCCPLCCAEIIVDGISQVAADGARTMRTKWTLIDPALKHATWDVEPIEEPAPTRPAFGCLAVLASCWRQICTCLGRWPTRSRVKAASAGVLRRSVQTVFRFSCTVNGPC